MNPPSTQAGAGQPNFRSLDQAFFDSLFKAIHHVLRVCARMDSSVKAGILEYDPRRVRGDYAGISSVQTAAFRVAVGITFPAETLAEIISRILDKPGCNLELDEISTVTVGFVRQIIRQAQLTLKEASHPILPGEPLVVFGQAPVGDFVRAEPRVVFPIESDAGPFFLEIRFAKTRRSAHDQ